MISNTATRYPYSAYFWRMEETQRQKKVGGVLQADLADVLQRAASDGGMQGVLISVTKVRVTTDLSVAKAYLSVFPEDKGPELLAGIRSNQPLIRKELAARTRHQLRKMPELMFYIDDTLAYLDKIGQQLKGADNPIARPELLDKRKKI
jgi:ribosome-binding factor A